MLDRPAPERHVPVRSCVACRSRRPQGELLRLARTPQGLAIDPQRRAPGRGAYVCPDKPGCHATKGLRRFARGEAEALAQRLAEWRATTEPGDNRAPRAGVK